MCRIMRLAALLPLFALIGCGAGDLFIDADQQRPADNQNATNDPPQSPGDSIDDELQSTEPDLQDDESDENEPSEDTIEDDQQPEPEPEDPQPEPEPAPVLESSMRQQTQFLDMMEVQVQMEAYFDENRTDAPLVVVVGPTRDFFDDQRNSLSADFFIDRVRQLAWDSGLVKEDEILMANVIEINYIYRGHIGFPGEHSYPEDHQITACQVAWIIDNAEQFNSDPNKVIVFGFSGAGHAAIVLTLDPLGQSYDPTNGWIGNIECPVDDSPLRDPGVLGVITSGSPLDMDTHCPSAIEFFGQCKFDSQTKEEWINYDPMQMMQDNFGTENPSPPGLFLQGTNDLRTPWQNTVNFGDAHAAQGDRFSEYNIFSNVPHTSPWFQIPGTNEKEAINDAIPIAQDAMMRMLFELTHD